MRYKADGFLAQDDKMEKEWPADDSLFVDDFLGRI
jgi:hypothetical protein